MLFCESPSKKRKLKINQRGKKEWIWCDIAGKCGPWLGLALHFYELPLTVPKETPTVFAVEKQASSAHIKTSCFVAKLGAHAGGDLTIEVD